MVFLSVAELKKKLQKEDRNKKKPSVKLGLSKADLLHRSTKLPTEKNITPPKGHSLCMALHKVTLDPNTGTNPYKRGGNPRNPSKRSFGVHSHTRQFIGVANFMQDIHQKSAAKAELAPNLEREENHSLADGFTTILTLNSGVGSSTGRFLAWHEEKL